MIFGISYAHWLVIVSCLLAIFSSWTYLPDTIQAKTKSNLVTRGLRGLALLIGISATLSANVDPRASVSIALVGMIPVIVFVAALRCNNRNSYRKISRFDIACGLSFFLSLIFWIYAKGSVMAVLLAALGDAFAALPTMLKAWKYPQTQSGIIFFMSFLGALLVIQFITERSNY